MTVTCQQLTVIYSLITVIFLVTFFVRNNHHFLNGLIERNLQN